MVTNVSNMSSLILNQMLFTYPPINIITTILYYVKNKCMDTFL